MANRAFINGELAPTTVNPSLWRIARLNMANGLFKVTERLYQLGGFDIFNMTVIEGDTGLMLIDPLSTAEVARVAFDLYCSHRPKKPVVALILHIALPIMRRGEGNDRRGRRQVR